MRLRAGRRVRARSSVTERLRAVRYLAALDQAEHEAGGEGNPMLLDLLGLARSFVGLEEETLATFDAMNGARQAAVST